ncbi:MAG TPA: FprA family A-type flavoprotein, partial [Candidatus Enterenecus stercoripullorum]|nr:FprA family A-type flavoprotein [Candidatus Enterenecus stercoripullorum]
MYCVRKVTDDLLWIGGNDRQHPLFESAHPVPRGMSFNSYLLLDEKT